MTEMTGIALALLAAFLLVASAYDVTVRRIPNVLALAMLLTGTALAVVTHGLAGGAIALGFVVTGLLVWLPFYIFRMMGAGDVKLFAAACAWLASFTQLFLAAL